MPELGNRVKCWDGLEWEWANINEFDQTPDNSPLTSLETDGQLWTSPSNDIGVASRYSPSPMELARVRHIQPAQSIPTSHDEKEYNDVMEDGEVDDDAADNDVPDAPEADDDAPDAPEADDDNDVPDADDNDDSSDDGDDAAAGNVKGHGGSTFDYNEEFSAFSD